MCRSCRPEVHVAQILVGRHINVRQSGRMMPPALHAALKALPTKLLETQALSAPVVPCPQVHICSSIGVTSSLSIMHMHLYACHQALDDMSHLHGMPFMSYMKPFLLPAVQLGLHGTLSCPLEHKQCCHKALASALQDTFLTAACACRPADISA